MPEQSPPVATEPNGPAPAGRGKLLVGTALLVLIVAGAITFLNRKSETKPWRKKPSHVGSDGGSGAAESRPGNDELVLPGNLQAFEESPIFARTNGTF